MTRGQPIGVVCASLALWLAACVGPVEPASMEAWERGTRHGGGPCAGDHWTIDDDGPADFASIAEAMASPAIDHCDRFDVAAGTYEGAVITTDGVRLDGEGGATILAAPWGLEVNADDVRIEGFTFASGDLFDFGIYAREGVSGLVIEDNTFVDQFSSIEVDPDVVGLVASHNTFENDFDGDCTQPRALFGMSFHGGDADVEISHNRFSAGCFTFAGGLAFWGSASGFVVEGNDFDLDGGVAGSMLIFGLLSGFDVTGNDFGHPEGAPLYVGSWVTTIEQVQADNTFESNVNETFAPY